jgi:hypothetical protein
LSKELITKRIFSSISYAQLRLKEKARMKAPSPELSLSEQMTAKKLREE